AATWLLFVPLLEISNKGVCRRRPPGSFGRMVAEDPQIGAEAARNPRHDLVDREMVERIEEPEAILLDRSAEIGVRLPEEQRRVARIAVCGQFRRDVVAHPAAGLGGDVEEPLDRLSPPLNPLPHPPPPPFPLT